MINPELEIRLAAARAHLDEVNARLLKAMKNESADIGPLTRLRDFAGGQAAKLAADAENLTVRAPDDGVWVSPQIEDRRGSWLERGSDLGLLVNPAAYKFVATVMEADVNALFASDIRGAAARLYGEAGISLPVTNWQVVPGGQQVLPSAALGWSAGGEMPVAMENNAQGNKTVEPFFEVRGDLDARNGVILLDGRSGKVRFQLPSEPLLPRWIRSLRQLPAKALRNLSHADRSHAGLPAQRLSRAAAPAGGIGRAGEWFHRELPAAGRCFGVPQARGRCHRRARTGPGWTAGRFIAAAAAGVSRAIPSWRKTG